MEREALFSRLGLVIPAHGKAGGAFAQSVNPATSEVLGEVPYASRGDYDMAVGRAKEAFLKWRMVPAPQRGELVRRIGERLRLVKGDLGKLVTMEAGKIRAEGLGEVQEMIDMAEFAVGLSRQLHGLTIASERPSHRLMEQWHPLGVVGVITAFNFPVAVWAWNAMLSLVCGNTVIWKPSPLTPLSALTVSNLVEEECRAFGHPHLCQMVMGGADHGTWMADDERVALVSATGSTAMGRDVGTRVAKRLGKSLLELGGNNGAILASSANLELALRGVVFAAVGTAGQRCTTLRRLFVHRSLEETVTNRLVQIYEKLILGYPQTSGVLVGPVIRAESVERHRQALAQAVSEGGTILCGGDRQTAEEAKQRWGGFFVSPAIVKAKRGMEVVKHETFSPILYLFTFDTIEEAIALNNEVPQGLSSSIFTERFGEAEQFLSAWGSDCGIANVNVGTSGAEIGGAFGGEKETGGGREAGSDAWKAYMRRQTCTLNYGTELPLAQGVVFDW
ncbi:MAG: aldehyde dehydrogenase family protein [Planctomycetaceae bacterium]